MLKANTILNTVKVSLNQTSEITDEIEIRFQPWTNIINWSFF